MADVNHEVIKDFGVIDEDSRGSWKTHLALVKWYDNEPKLDLRKWNEDMTKCSKGFTFTKEEAFELLNLLEDAI